MLLLCDEELGSFGAKYVLDLGLPVPIPKQVIIGEPTSLKVVRMHKGHLSIQISIHGQSAHTGAPHLGKNAVIVAAEVVTALAALGAEYEQKQTASSQFFPEITSFPVLSVATIEGGSAINVVPDLCKLGVGLRLLPDQEEEEVIKELKSTIDDSCDLPWELEILGNNPTMLTQEEVQINRWLCNNIGQEESYGVSFGTDGGFLSKADFQCVLYGAGDIAVAHKPDEFVPVKEMETCSRTIDAAITHFCGELS